MGFLEVVGSLCIVLVAVLMSMGLLLIFSAEFDEWRIRRKIRRRYTKK